MGKVYSALFEKYFFALLGLYVKQVTKASRRSLKIYLWFTLNDLFCKTKSICIALFLQLADVDIFSRHLFSVSLLWQILGKFTLKFSKKLQNFKIFFSGKFLTIDWILSELSFLKLIIVRFNIMLALVNLFTFYNWEWRFLGYSFIMIKRSRKYFSPETAE